MPDTLTPPTLLVNGRLVSEDAPSLSAIDRGVSLGDGIFETMRGFGHRVFHLESHFQRLARSAAVMRLPLPPLDDLARDVYLALAQQPYADVVVRLAVSRGPDRGRGVLLPEHPAPTIVLRVTPMTPPLASPQTPHGVRAIISSIRRNETSPLARIKSNNYGDAILARLESTDRGFDEAILLNTRGEVATATTSNLFIVSGNRLLTPPESAGALRGIARGCVMEIAKRSGLAVIEEAFLVDTLLQANEAFLTNIVLGVRPLVAVDDTPLGDGAVGGVATLLGKAFEDLVAHELDRS
ncbi:MAG: aminotransferase class IV [Chloroflexi bacterium]|nr:aminotransferase class IV [Chloroflexota bacterium]